MKQFLSRWRWEFGLAGAILVVGTILALSEIGQDHITATRQLITSVEAQNARVTQLFGYVADAESGQRGFLLTNRVSYLSTYRSSMRRAKQSLEELAAHYNTDHDSEGSRKASRLSTLIGERFSEMNLVLKQAEQGDTAQTVDLINSDVGRNKMLEIREAVNELVVYNNKHAYALRQNAVEVSNTWRVLVAAVTAINALLLIFVFRRLGEAWRKKERQTQNMLMQQEHLDAMVRERTQQLEYLSVHLQELIEEEKTRLARELHDELGSILTATKMDAAWVRRHLDQDTNELAGKLERILKNIDLGITVKRRLIEDLRPSTLTSFGLVVAARELAEETASRNDWQLDIELPQEEPALQADTATALFRVLQESLNNASKYAKARSVQIRMVCEDQELRLDIVDDGVGFHPHQIRTKVHGLAGMKQRITARDGKLEIRSQPGSGCHISVVLPLRRTEQCENASDDGCKTEAIQIS